MDTCCVGEEFRVPVDIKDIKEGDEGLVVDPEDTIVHEPGVVQVVVELFLHFGCPVLCVLFGVVALPSCPAPGVFQQE